MEINDKTKNWIAVYTKSRHEKTVAKKLEMKNFEVYLPLLRERRKWSDRKKWIEYPLFKSYLFIRTQLKNSIFILKTPGIIRIVKFGDKIAIVNANHINAIKLMISGGYKPNSTDYFIKGDEVSVISGPLKGVNGIIQDLKGDSRLIMKVEAIRQAFSIEISSEQLKLKKKNVSKVL